jgi:phage-related tail fiber protein
VDSAVVGIDWKPSVRLATTAAITLATGLENGDTLDGVTLATGDRVLVKNQTDATENGIYVVAASGAPSRSSDADTAAEITASFAVFVEEGTVNTDSGWTLTNNGAVTVGTTELSFTQFTGLGQITAGAGLTKTANTLDVIGGDGITVNADSVVIDRAVVVTKYATNVGDGTNTSYTITHNLATRDVIVSLFDNSSPYAEVMADVEHSTTNTITLLFSVAPTTDKYRVVVHA